MTNSHTFVLNLLPISASREEVQKRTFEKWVNMYLKPRGVHVTDLFADLQDGVLLLQLLEELSGQKLVRNSSCIQYSVMSDQVLRHTTYS